MEYTFLGRTGLSVSRLCLGTMSFGGDADEPAARAMYALCRDRGINHFDCANVYNGGAAEEILGRLIKGDRNRVVVSTKVYFPTGAGPNDRGASRYHLRSAVEASLRRLGTDRIDLLYLHRFDEYTALDETLRALDDLVRAGKVLHPALSNFAAWQAVKACSLADARGWCRPVALQPMYNLLKRQAEVELLPMAAAEGLAVFPYSPLAGGYLTGKYRAGAPKPAPEARLRSNQMYRVRYGVAGYQDIADQFVALAEAEGWHPTTLAIAWVLSHPAVTAPILGARSVEQLAPSLEALERPLDPSLRAKVTALSPTPPPATDRNEESSAHNFGSRVPGPDSR